MTPEQVRAIISSPDYAYSRQGDRLSRGGSWMYIRVPSSPTGVHAAGWAVNEVHDPILREVRNNSSLSPTER